jgi:hypothetical protein
VSILFTGSLSGMAEALDNVAKVQIATDQALGRGVARGVLLGEAIVKGKASGRPGPRFVSGDFRRSIVGDSEIGVGTILGQIGTNAAQGRRLEYGFVGVDVLGRRYNQPPYPYLQPAVPEVEAAIISEVTKAVGEAFG